MAEIGFSLFFLLALVAALAALGHMVLGNRGRIIAALDRRLVAAPAPERILSVRTCAPIDLPYVARRMNRGAAALRPPLHRRKAAA